MELDRPDTPVAVWTRTWTGEHASFQDSTGLSEKETGHILGQYQRVLAVTFVRCQAACLVARMRHLAEAAKECAGRRRVAMQEWQRMREEAAAFFLAHIQRRGC